MARSTGRSLDSGWRDLCVAAAALALLDEFEDEDEEGTFGPPPGSPVRLGRFHRMDLLAVDVAVEVLLVSDVSILSGAS